MNIKSSDSGDTLLRSLLYSFCGVIVLIGAAIVFLKYDANKKRIERKPWEYKMVIMHDRMQLGMSIEEVKKIIAHQNWPTNQITRLDGINGYIEIFTPIMIPSDAWVMMVGFDSGQVESVSFGTVDRLDIHPEYAPQTKGKERKWNF